MRALTIAVAIAALFNPLPSFAQSEEEMQLQRCIWGCLARSTGNNDPAYHACVEKICTATQPSPRNAPATQGHSGGQSDPATVTFVQESLADLGFEPGPIDGEFGSKTEAAIRAFQISRGLGASGAIDDALVAALRSANQVSKTTVASDSSTSGNSLDVPVVEQGGDGQAANCASSIVTGLKADGDGFLAVRSGPGTEYRKIDELHNGDIVYTYDRKGDWVGIAYDVSTVECASRTTRPVPYGMTGWVHGDWLRDLAG